MKDSTSSANNECEVFHPLPSFAGPLLEGQDYIVLEGLKQIYSNYVAGTVFDLEHDHFDDEDDPLESSFDSAPVRGYALVPRDSVDKDYRWDWMNTDRPQNMAYMSKQDLEKLEPEPNTPNIGGVRTPEWQDWHERAMRTFGHRAASHIRRNMIMNDLRSLRDSI